MYGIFEPPPLPWTIKNSWYQIGSEVKEIKKVQKSKETRCQTSQEVEDVKTEVEPSARARYSKIPSVCMYVCLYVCDNHPALTTPTNFLKFGVKVGDH